MGNIIHILSDKTINFDHWSVIRRYAGIGIAPLLLIGAVYVWQNTAILNSRNDQVLSITSADNQLEEEKGTPLHSEVSTQKESIFIDISGAVNQPGIKELAINARVNDAIWSASGYAAQADLQYLAQALNLAQPLHDGDKIYIPTYYEVSQALPDPPVLLNKIHEPIGVLTGSTEKKSTQVTNVEEGKDDQVEKININTASQAELEDLPGIGEVTAKKIIEGRPYASTSDLCSNKIVTNSTTCEKIQGLISTQ